MKTPPYPKSGAYLKMYRLNTLNITQAQLIEPFGLNVQAVSNWERGLAMAPPDILWSCFMQFMTPSEVAEFKQALSDDLLQKFLNKVRVFAKQVGARGP